ncbi:MAG: TIGR04283 family arsenosugar biosynthesis glycosyltransferase [Candidatus Omnitrophica bacterium]|nr:TIGR04283 family arsenosugar biosynthesis glycosyltransferase [Candidatus Omnitrophota bacterium]
MISIIIPVLNEEKVLTEQKEYFETLSAHAQLIFVDVGSDDQTSVLAAQWGELLTAPKGRASQMNRGVDAAKGRILLFLHADTRIQPEALQMVEDSIFKNVCDGGCFTQVIERQGWIYRWIAFTGSCRARWTKIFYGDQGIFIRRDKFLESGGFPEVALCEDILFTRNIRKKVKLTVLKDPVFCSSRRWDRQGLLKTFFINLRINRCILFNQDFDRLAKLYRDIR